MTLDHFSFCLFPWDLTCLFTCPFLLKKFNDSVEKAQKKKKKTTALLYQLVCFEHSMYKNTLTISLQSSIPRPQVSGTLHQRHRTKVSETDQAPQQLLPWASRSKPASSLTPYQVKYPPYSILTNHVMPPFSVEFPLS